MTVRLFSSDFSSFSCSWKEQEKSEQENGKQENEQ